jgi:hypothetical protein
MTSTSTTEDTGAAILAARRAARARTAADLAATKDLAKMTRKMGEDAIATAALAALERGGPADGPATVAAAWEGARQARANLTRADAARARREQDTGRMLTREDRADRLARVLGQRGEMTTRPATTRAQTRKGRTVGAVTVPAVHTVAHGEAIDDRAPVRTFALPTLALPPALVWTRGEDRATREARAHHLARLADVTRWATVAAVGWAPTVTRGAVAGAIAADGPVSRADHDPAGCSREGCRVCRSTRDAAGLTIGPLARPTADGTSYRRPARADRAPREVTTDRAVSIAPEASLLAMIDQTRAMGAKGTGAHESAAPAADVRPAAVTLADLATVTTRGARGKRVLWVEASLALGLHPRAVPAWRTAVAGYVLAWAIDTGAVSADAIPALATRADVGTAALYRAERVARRAMAAGDFRAIARPASVAPRHTGPRPAPMASVAPTGPRGPLALSADPRPAYGPPVASLSAAHRRAVAMMLASIAAPFLPTHGPAF